MENKEMFSVIDIDIKYVRKRPDVEFQIRSSQDAYDVIKKYFDDFVDHHEESYAMILDRSNKVINIQHLGKGSNKGTVVDENTLYQAAILCNGTGVILFHNHPSGNKEASKNDLDLTKKIVKSLKILNKDLLDHIIVTHDGYYSMADDDLI